MTATIDMQALADRAAIVRSRVRLSRVIGADVKLRQAGAEMTGLCPFHGEKRDGAFMVNDDKQLYKCFACGAHGDVIAYIMARKGWTFMRTLRDLEADAGIDFRDAKAKAAFDRTEERRIARNAKDAERKRRNAHNMWLTAAPMRETPAHLYLRDDRGIDFEQLRRFPGAIRYRVDVWNKELGKEIPAMLTAIHAPDGKFLAVHRTYLEWYAGRWRKARVEKPKMVLGDFMGGFMPLWKGEERTSIANMSAGLAVAQGEGIEDCLSVAMAEPSFRIIAAVSLDNIGNVRLPPQAGDLILLGQRDGDIRSMRADAARAAGRIEEAEEHERVRRLIEGSMERAIGKQRARAIEQGSTRDVRVAWPSPGFKDFNDELRGVRMGDGNA